VSESIRPRKSLGQHFLRDPRISRKIVDALGPRHDDVVLEIGPGEGALTELLAATECTLVLVDLDLRVVEAMRNRLPGRVEILHRDILTVDPAIIARDHARSRLRIVGNIPYYITTPILFHFLDARESVEDLILMMQREVGRRIVASPDSKEYGILSVISQMHADVEALFDVQPGSFFPRPAVTSTVIRLRMLPRPRYELQDERAFRKIVRTAFNKRRKTLRNSLRDLGVGDVEAIDADMLSRRPEQLTLEEFARLSNALAHRLAIPHQSLTFEHPERVL